jgi:cobaltochelatase CobS
MNKVQIDIRPLFGLQHVPVPVKMEGYDQPSENTPARMDGYVWPRELLNDMRAFWITGDRACQLIGHFGTGKSSFVEQFHNRLNLPLYVVNCHPRMEAGDLIGKFYPDASGALQFIDGPLVRAAREGQSILLDEYNLLDPGEATGLNALLEGRAVFLPETGAWVKPQPGFRIFATVNPKALGYAGRNTQDVANDDRFCYMNVDYMPEAAEVDLLRNVLMTSGMKDISVATKFAKQFREVADAVRKVFMGVSDESGALDITLSTRSLVRWAKYTLIAKPYQTKGFSPVHYALERAKTFKASSESRVAIHAMVHQFFGEEYITPLTHPHLLTQAAAQAATPAP